MVRRKSNSMWAPFASVPAQRIRAVTKATSVPAVTLISLMSNLTGSSDQEKNVSQVLRYDSSAFDCRGGGTSNITMLGEWLRRIPEMSFLRTELAQSSTSLRIAVVGSCVAIIAPRTSRSRRRATIAMEHAPTSRPVLRHGPRYRLACGPRRRWQGIP